MIKFILYIVMLSLLLLNSYATVVVGGSNKTRKEKKHWLLVLLLAGLTIYLYYNSIEAIDSINYRSSFSNIENINGVNDRLYYEFAKLVKRLGGSYEALRGIVGAISLIPVLIIIRNEKNSINTPYFLLLFLIFPFFQNIVALKNTISSVFVVLGFYYYFKSQKKLFPAIIAYTAIGIAMMFHDSAVIYLAIFTLFLALKKIAYIRKTYIILFVLITIQILLLRSGLINSFLYRMAGESNTSYIARLSNIGFGFLLITFIHLVYFYFTLHVGRDITNENEQLMYNDIMVLNYATLMIIPFYSINALFFRIYRNVLLFNYLIMSQRLKTGGKNERIYSVLLILLAIITALYDANGIESILSVLRK